MPRTFVDTNVLVYSVDRSEPEKRKRSVQALRELGPDCVLSAQVLGEFYVIVTRKLASALTAEAAAEQVTALSRGRVVKLDEHLLRRAIDLSRTARLSYWDALILAAAASSGCERILTEDLQHGQTIAGVRIENPFA